MKPLYEMMYCLAFIQIIDYERKYLIFIILKMGGTQSVQDQINKATGKIAALHTNITEIQKIIIAEADKLVDDITTLNYDNPEFCDQLGYHYVDRLKTHFPVKVLEGVSDRLQLGLVPQENDVMVTYKDQVCKNIVAFYKKKIFLIEQIKKELPICISMESEVFSDLSDKLQSEGINTEKWIDVYKKVQQFNKDIKYRYSQIENSVGKIRAVQTWPKLNLISKNVINLLQGTTGMCKRYKTDLLRFAQATPEKVIVPTAAKRLTKPLPTVPITKPLPAVPITKPLPAVPITKPLPAVPITKPLPTVPITKPIPALPPKKPQPSFNIGDIKTVSADFTSTERGTIDVKKRTQVEILTEVEDGWVKIKIPTGEEGYISAFFLS
uniref:HNH endonuclease n=1 Tax=Pithovirus LCPAC302 TaxID=2506593 RepID=A0A481Z8W7_9VIRU|nr:MAG: HNH endonuclease [Pithovirus LCPAC302]QBK91549.1 MAG: SH3 domain protein [Pithovirus LCPAC302]